MDCNDSETANFVLEKHRRLAVFEFVAHAARIVNSHGRLHSMDPFRLRLEPGVRISTLHVD